MAVKRFAGDKFTFESTDSKPTNLLNGATGWELDTGKLWFWFNGAWAEVPTGGSKAVVYGTTITAAANLSRANQNFKTTLFDNASATNLTLLLADWVVGDWFVIRQFGDGRATILAENSNVKLPAWNKTIAKGYDMYIECYSIVGSDKFFHITGGTL
jgi:hypothetical protein